MVEGVGKPRYVSVSKWGKTNFKKKFLFLKKRKKKEGKGSHGREKGCVLAQKKPKKKTSKHQ